MASGGQEEAALQRELELAHRELRLAQSCFVTDDRACHHHRLRLSSVNGEPSCLDNCLRTFQAVETSAAASLEKSSHYYG